MCCCSCCLSNASPRVLYIGVMFRSVGDMRGWFWKLIKRCKWLSKNIDLCQVLAVASWLKCNAWENASMSSDQKKDYGVEILNHQSLLLRRSGHKITLKYIDNQINASSEFCFIRVCSFWCFHQKLRFSIFLSEDCFQRARPEVLFINRTSNSSSAQYKVYVRTSDWAIDLLSAHLFTNFSMLPYQNFSAY